MKLTGKESMNLVYDSGVVDKDKAKYQFPIEDGTLLIGKIPTSLGWHVCETNPVDIILEEVPLLDIAI